MAAGVADCWAGAWGDAWGGAWGGLAAPAPDRNESGGSAKRARQQRELAARNQEIIMAVVGIVTSGALDQ